MDCTIPWKQFCRVIGEPSWCKEERFGTGPNRLKHQDELDPLVEEWTLRQEHYRIMNALQKAGVAAGAIPTGPELLADPHLKERSMFQMVTRAFVGTHLYPRGTPMQIAASAIGIRRPAPTFGQHNEYVLGELLGMPRDEIEDLSKEQVIGTMPVSVQG